VSAAVLGEITCRELVELVTDYLEDRLPPGQRTRFELHVHSCTGCHAYLAQMRALIRLSALLAEERPAPSARDELLSAFRGWKRA
jgi:anti-sigma factor RsiW